MRFERIVAPAYLIATLLVVFPLFDSAAQFWPFDPTTLQWRFGALGLFSQALMTPLLGLLVLLVTAAASSHVGAQRAIGVVAAVTAAGWLLFAGLFSLDALSMHRLVDDQARAAVGVSSIVVLAKYVLAAASAAGLGFAGISSAREQKRRSAKSSRNQQMVFGASSKWEE